MKRINIKNLMLQFDEGAFSGTPFEQAQNLVEHVNEVLAEQANQDACPRLMVTALDKSDVEVVDDGEGGWDETEAGDHDRIKAWLRHVGGNKQDTIIVDAAWKTYLDTDENEALSILTNATGDDPGVDETYMARFYNTLKPFCMTHGGKTIKAALAFLAESSTVNPIVPPDQRGTTQKAPPGCGVDILLVPPATISIPNCPNCNGEREKGGKPGHYNCMFCGLTNHP